MRHWVNSEKSLYHQIEQPISGASRMRAGQGICVLRQGILGHFRPLLDIFGAKGLFKETFLFEGRGCISPPPRCASEILNSGYNIGEHEEHFLASLVRYKIIRIKRMDQCPRSQYCINILVI